MQKEWGTTNGCWYSGLSEAPGSYPCLLNKFPPERKHCFSCISGTLQEIRHKWQTVQDVILWFWSQLCLLVPVWPQHHLVTCQLMISRSDGLQISTVKASLEEGQEGEQWPVQMFLLLCRKGMGRGVLAEAHSTLQISAGIGQFNGFCDYGVKTENVEQVLESWRFFSLVQCCRKREDSRGMWNSKGLRWQADVYPPMVL